MLIIIFLGISLALAVVNFAESSITSLSPAKLKSLKVLVRERSWQAIIRWIHHPEEYLTLLLLLGNILEAFYAWALLGVLASFLTSPQMRELVVLLLGVPLALFFLNLTPKVLARRSSQSWVTLAILRILHAILLPLYPFLRSFFYLLRRLSGGESTQIGALGKSVTLSLAELSEVLDAIKATGSQGSIPVEMMKNVLRLEEVKLENVLTPKPQVSALDKKVLDPQKSSLADRERALFSLMTDGYARTLILEEGLPIAYIHAKDLTREILKDREFLKSSDRLLSLCRKMPCLKSNQSLAEALPILSSGSPIAWVKDDRENNWLGIVTIEDLLEEIMGEILDEFESRKRKVPRAGSSRPKEVAG